MNMKRAIFKSLLVIGIVQIYYLSHSQDFEVSPAKLYFNAEPGETQAIQINIFNHSNEKTKYVLALGDYQVNKSGDKITMPAGTTETSLVNWISILPPLIEINPNEEGKVTVSIQAPSGDYSTKWAFIYVRTAKEQTALSADKNFQTGIVVTGQIIIPTIQSPKSNANYKVKISNLNEIPSKDEKRTFAALLDNIGEKVAKCKITLIASNLLTAEETKLDEITCESYPESQLNISLKMNKALAPGKYALAAILDYGNKTNLEGSQMLLEVQ
jgi:hypothetical protein